ncbi:MAG: hypothetical protein GX855_09925 [Firmicutes bacterium]|nr:hypothetical protein [Bacillota bacterium]
MLTTLIVIPAAAALLLSFASKTDEKMLYWLIVAASLAPFLMVLQAWPNFGAPEAPEVMISFNETREWIPAIGASYSLGLDGLNLPFLALLTFIGITANLTLRSKEDLRKRGTLLLIWEAVLIGAFLAQDYILFLLFWTISTVPIYFLLEPGQADGKPSAAQSFALASLLSVLALGAGLLILSGSLGNASVAARELTNTVITNLDPDTQWWIFLAVFIGCGLRIPVFPLHTWLPATMERLPVSAKIFLVGGFLPLGVYGLLRFALVVLTDAAAAFAIVITAAGAVNLIFGSLAALGGETPYQKTAYLVMSYTGIGLLGIATLTLGGITGALFATFSLGLAIAFSLSIADPAACITCPRWAILLHGLEAAQHLRLPGFAGFIGLFLVFLAVFQGFRPLSLLIFAALFLTAVDYSRSMAAVVENAADGRENAETDHYPSRALAPLMTGAGAAAALLLGGSILLGVKPDLVLGVLEPAIKGLMQFLE